MQASAVVAPGLHNCRAQAQQLRHTGLAALWHVDPPGSGVETVSRALTGGFFIPSHQGSFMSIFKNLQ